MSQIVLARLPLQGASPAQGCRSLEQLCESLSIRIILCKRDPQHVFWLLESGEAMRARLHAALALAGAEFFAPPATGLGEGQFWTIAIVGAESESHGENQ